MSEVIDIRKLNSHRRQPEKHNRESSFFSFLEKDISISKTLSDKFKENFYAEIGSLLEAGIDLRTSLELVSAEYKKKQRLILEQVLGNIIGGSTFSSALEKIKDFSAYEYQSIKIGEETGALTKVLKELGIFFEKKVKQRRQIIGALTYPALVLTIAAGAITFMLSYVVPMFSDIYKRSGDELPGITKLVIALAGFIGTYGLSFFLFLLCLVAICVWQKNSLWFRSFSSKIALKIPIWGKLIQKIYLSRFSSTMSMLMAADIPMLQAISLTRQIITFYPFEKALKAAEKEIEKGLSLHKALDSHPIFPKKNLTMIRVGEEVNELESFFKKISDQNSNEVEHQVSILSKFVEPLIIVLLGLIVGIVLIAMYLPLFKLGQQF